VNHAKPDTTPRNQRNRPLRTISISDEAWGLLGEIAEEKGRSRSGMIETMIHSANANRKRRSRG
jgi:predicted CopG family antitoxin